VKNEALESRILNWLITLFMVLLSAIGSFGIKVVSSVGQDVKDLQKQFAVFLRDQSFQMTKDREQDDRIRSLEKECSQ